MKNRFKVSDIAKKLNVKKDVVRFWGKEFDLMPKTSDKTYSNEEFQAFTSIKKLIHDKGLPISEVKNQLKNDLETITTKNNIESQKSPQQALPQSKTPLLTESNSTSANSQAQATITPSAKATIEPEQTNQKAATVTKMETNIPKPNIDQKIVDETENIQVKEVEKIVEVEKPYIPQEFLDQVLLVKEKLIDLKKMLD